MERNPSHSSTQSASDAADVNSPRRQPHHDSVVPPATIQMVDISSRVPVTLDHQSKVSNYSNWRCLFQAIFAKHDLGQHVAARIRCADRTPEWNMNDATITKWIYATCSRELQNTVTQPEETAFDVWTTIEGLFGDNNRTRSRAFFCVMFN